ncbi:Trehalose-6-P synthase/phosphatase complex synthase subunit [Lithohypha guttulata]|uniref:Trehalose-6-P synthase/phosphatase complex synthase subunit n=1 Tax=Lithohypha guttulata TaxID=1690604 RepID=UPI002DE13F30|nr:Trehalose-6-P synthase/phosphatase complex synthase subunit [Lithohypha guttulata]
MPTGVENSKRADRRLLIVANRHPVTVKRTTDGQYSYNISSGGLVTGLSGLPPSLKDNSVYYGWPGIDVPPQEVEEVEAGMADKGGVPLWIDGRLMDMHYNGYSNSIVWPLFHYHANEMTFEEGPWEAYVKVNRLFAKKVAEDVRDNDIVWIHDYHLMLMPKMLREEMRNLNKKVRNLKVGFFLHIPWPSSMEFMKLPYREEVLESLLNADLCGFHTYDYARHFLSACHKILGLTTSPNGVMFDGRNVHVGAFPIGINPEKEVSAMKKENVISRVKELKEGSFKDKTVVISVDRLDYIKGLPHKFHAFDMFLENNPDFVGHAVLLQIVVPSRQDVKEYQILRSHISELAGRINAKYGTVTYQPIVYRHTSVPHDELVAMYALADACFVTSTRDGMNLVSYEYIACQYENHGQLVISEFAGAAQSMKGSIVINPWDTNDMIAALRKALTMSEAKKEENWKKMWDYVNTYTSANWGISFVDELTSIGTGEMPDVLTRQASDSGSDNEINGMNRGTDGVDKTESEHNQRNQPVIVQRDRMDSAGSGQLGFSDPAERMAPEAGAAVNGVSS